MMIASINKYWSFQKLTYDDYDHWTRVPLDR